VISIQNLTIDFGKGPVLENLSFEVAAGEVVFVLGRSGVGKSVLLKAMTGLLKPNRGTIRINHHDIGAMTENELLKFRRECALVFQNPCLFDSMTVQENLELALPKEERKKTSLIKALSDVHVNEEVLAKMPQELSVGIQKRISLARSLLLNPKIMLYDEPTTAIDFIAAQRITHLIKELSVNHHMTSLVVSHDLHFAFQIADKLLFLEKGVAIAFGSRDEILHHGHPLIKDFVREAELRAV
jgi:phospholipid/cholesterol/gamma-HCH transport system ATP-binding protein